MLATFLPLGFREGLLTRSFPLSWGDLCHRAKYPAVLHFPFWLLFSKATACSVRDFAFSSMADNEKYQTYGRIERILQWIPITYHLDFTINIQLHLLYHHHPSFYPLRELHFFFWKRMVQKHKEKRETSPRLERGWWIGALWWWRPMALDFTVPERWKNWEGHG